MNIVLLSWGMLDLLKEDSQAGLCTQVILTIPGLAGTTVQFLNIMLIP